MGAENLDSDISHHTPATADWVPRVACGQMSVMLSLGCRRSRVCNRRCGNLLTLFDLANVIQLADRSGTVCRRRIDLCRNKTSRRGAQLSAGKSVPPVW